MASIDIAPESSLGRNLSQAKQSSISIPPKPVYHLAIINACKVMHEQHPDQSDREEVEQFNFYVRHKSNTGDPIEQNVVYLPIGGL